MKGFVSGKLKFKGNHQKFIENLQEKNKLEQQPQFELEQNNINAKNTKNSQQLEIKQGIGRILSNGKTVHGMKTQFKTDNLNEDDIIIIVHPESLQKQSRNIEIVLSQFSLILKEPFSSDLISYTEYQYQKKPLQQDEESLEQKYQSKILNQSKKIQKEKTMVEYRVKKAGQWGYYKQKEEMPGKYSQEELLDLRIKKTSDKFCWI